MNLNKNQLFEALKIQKLPFGFKLNHIKSDREYNFFSELLTETNLWVTAINAVKLIKLFMRFKIYSNKGHEQAK